MNVKNEKMSFLDSQTYKGDCKFYFQCNKKFGRWRYYQKTPKSKSKVEQKLHEFEFHVQFCFF